MKGLRDRLAWAALCAALLLQGCGSSLPAAQADAPSSADRRQAVADGGEVLVMVRSDVRSRFQPGSSGLGDYGVAPAPQGMLRTAAAIAHDHNLRLLSDWPMPSLGLHCFLMRVPQDADVAPALAALNADRRIEWAQPSQRYRVLAHSDPYYSLQSAARDLRLDEAHQASTGRGVLIAEIDTGIDVRHPDLEGQVREAENFIDRSPYVAEIHGTAVAGIIAGRADNGVGIVGVAPSAALLGLRACRETGSFYDAECDTFSLAKALQFALRREANVINLSLSGPYDRLLAALVDKALARDTVVVAAADPRRSDGGFPARQPGVIAVAAEGAPSAPETPTILAPGADVLTTAPPAGWAFFSGSSMAAAHVSGVVALMLARKPSASPALILRALQQGLEIRSGRSSASLDACLALGEFVATGPCSGRARLAPVAIPVSQARELSAPR